jgi:hypothetical protein
VGIGAMKTLGGKSRAMRNLDRNKELATERGFHPWPAGSCLALVEGGDSTNVPAKRAPFFPLGACGGSNSDGPSGSHGP